MKQLYTTLFSISFIAAGIFGPQRLSAQCNCPNGDPIDSVIYTRNLSGILPFNSNITFPRFDPAIGSLSCVRISGNVTTTLTMDLVNRDNTSRVMYEMFYTRVTSLTGPGISVSANENRIYGPYDLGQATVDPDTLVAIGPDVLFNNRFITQQTSNTVPYTGASGTVSFTYYNNGSYLMTQGNDNFGLNVAAASVVAIRMVYYWCPNMILPTSINSFSVVRKNNHVNVLWASNDELPNNSYVVEYSTDGKQFTAVNERKSSGDGAAYYSYEFDPAVAGDSRRLYFRIREVDEKGRKRYTAVKTISFTENGSLNPVIYPNPAVKNVTIQFEAPQSGPVDIDLVNATGQILEHQTQTTSKTTNLSVSLQKRYIKGLYWLRVRNRETGNQSVTRLSLQ